MKSIVMFRTLPKTCYLAFSGGIDSVVLLHLLVQKKINVTLVHINHLTPYCQKELEFAKLTAKEYNIPLLTFEIGSHTQSSLEAHWSKSRYKIFNSLPDHPALTAHHLDDCVESYIMTSMQGCSKLINYNAKNVYRPLILTTKEQIIYYANHHKLKYLTDPTNLDPNHCLRNKVRLELLGNIKQCFPGIRTTVRKLILKKENIK